MTFAPSKRIWRLSGSDPDSDDPLKTAVSGVQYTYDTQLQVYTRGADGSIMVSDLQTLMQEMMGDYLQTDFSGMLALRDSAMTSTQSAMMNSMALWREMLPGEDGAVISPLYKSSMILSMAHGRLPITR